MKITKRQLIRLIKESMYDPRTLPADNIPISMIGVHGKNRKEKLHNISKSSDVGYKQADELIKSLKGTPAVIDMEGGYGAAAKKGQELRDLDFLRPLIEKDKDELDKMGFDYIGDVHSGAEYEGHGPMFRFQAGILECPVENLAYIESSLWDGDRGFGTMDEISDILERKNIQAVPFPTNNHNFGYNQLYDINGLKILHTEHWKSGYSLFTYTICG